MKKLTLSERQKLVNEVYQDHAKKMLIEADRLIADDVDDAVKQALDRYAIWFEEDKEREFRKDVKFALALAGGIVFGLSLWYILYILGGGLL